MAARRAAEEEARRGGGVIFLRPPLQRGVGAQAPEWGVGAMSETLRRVQTLVLGGEYLVTRHAFRELAAMVSWLKMCWPTSKPLFDRGLSGFHERSRQYLVLQHDRKGPLHVMWGRSERMQELQP